ncbi:MAG TPA: CDP-alcohol phosphatidyltransferase family protein [Polyangia bacterium]|jgi:CDP-diacylglycerol--serine O-phosphatidyltransferase|nr:CDP-alcohol phosphatidyltransferase family protein [Polyangia bacterium]
MAQPPSGPHHFSLLRQLHLADAFTLGNGFAGTGAVLAFMQFLLSDNLRYYWLGAALLPFALVMDILDGRVARWRHKASPMGLELDSLADVVSFGVAPAAMGFATGLRGGWDAALLVYFVGCGISRLARYNVSASSLSDDQGKVTHFQGLPIPTSLLLAAILAALAAAGRSAGELPLGALQLGPWQLHPVAVLYFIHGSAMISKTLRIPKP